MMKWYVKLILPSIWLHYQVEWNKRKQSWQLWPWLIPSCLLSFVDCNRTTDPFNISTTPPHPPATTFPQMQLACASLIYLRETRGMTGEESGLMTCLAEVLSQLFDHTTRICKVSYGPCTKMNFKKMVFRCRPLIPKLIGHTWVIIRHEQIKT